MTRPLRLGVNIDHVATLRNARGTPYPDPVQAALLAAGCQLHFDPGAVERLALLDQGVRVLLLLHAAPCGHVDLLACPTGMR